MESLEEHHILVCVVGWGKKYWFHVNCPWSQSREIAFAQNISTYFSIFRIVVSTPIID